MQVRRGGRERRGRWRGGREGGREDWMGKEGGVKGSLWVEGEKEEEWRMVSSPHHSSESESAHIYTVSEGTRRWRLMGRVLP
jgi:hypothetical protein